MPSHLNFKFDKHHKVYPFESTEGCIVKRSLPVNPSLHWETQGRLQDVISGEQ